MFSYQELYLLQNCVSYAGKNMDATPSEAETLRALMEKLDSLTSAAELEAGPVPLEVQDDLEPEP